MIVVLRHECSKKRTKVIVNGEPYIANATLIVSKDADESEENVSK